MKAKRRGMAGTLRRVLPVGLMGWLLCGCDAPPDMMPIAPPGAPVPRKSPDEESAQAVGEMAAPALTHAAATAGKVVEYTPAPPTAKGETKTTPGGVKYETLKEGTGPELKAGQTAQFIHEGRFPNGKPIDERSPRIKRPEEISLGEKLDGWKEALPGMRVGEVRKLIMPASVAFGDKGRPPGVAADATVIYEVELVHILGE